MQTFLPYASFERSARALDDRRLGKQRVEVLQVLNALHGLRQGWRNHPAVRMWRGHEEALVEYGQAVAREWRRRGHADTCLGKIEAFSRPGRTRARPPWLGDRAFHRAHRSALVRKDPARYGPLFPGVPDDLPYVWPAGPAVEQV
ncbi:MAG: MSMEG_6728 family protein [Planctomycetes bacterium]|nr:MSMEG_6728 family protein [Planctomycetota bacterium]